MDIGFITRRTQWPCQRVSGNRPAVSFEDGETWSFDELHRRVNRYANALLARGVCKGDRVGILLYNGLEYWAIYLAATRIGAIAVRLNFRLTAEELDFAIQDSGSTTLCFHSSFAGTLDQIRDRLPVQHHIALEHDGIPVPDWAAPWSVLDSASDQEPDRERPAPTDPAMLMYTSGTTGRPKGALWNHANTLWFTAIQALQWGLDENTVAMTTGPMYHVGAVEDLTSAALAAGGHAVVLKSGGFSIRRVLEIVERRQVTDLFLFPFMIYELAQLDATEAERYSLSSLKRILSGGDPLLPWATRTLQRRYPWIQVIQVYGLTEGTPIAACSTGEETLQHPESVGRPMPFTEISLRDDQGDHVPSGAEGEIWIRSPVVCNGYWQRPDANRETFVDGWCRTGDLGRLNEAGLLCISGRKKDMIRSGGENVYPAEVEDVLMRLDGIREAAVIAVPHPRFIETVCAVVVPKDGSMLSADAVIDHCRQHLAGYKCPKHVVFAQELPRTPSGKLMKYRLREEHRHLGSTPG
ncbi:MAG: acyl--CoA ligase [Ectothiorhodospiraceae bacterium]|nr:acyl--CoA ligase [Ectothiorhodospiraceae bacterium]